MKNKKKPLKRRLRVLNYNFKMFWNPFCVYLNKKYPIRIKQGFKNSLKNRFLFRLTYGMDKINFLKKFKSNNSKNAWNKLYLLKFLSLLERRLDVALCRVEFTRNIYTSKHLISHKNVYVNGKIVNKKGFILKKGDIVTLTSKQSLEIPKKLRSNSLFEINYKIPAFVVLKNTLSVRELTQISCYRINFLDLLMNN